MKLTIQRQDDAFLLESKNNSGHTTHTDASETIGGHNHGFRPMELLLNSLASCSAIDVLNILYKQKQVVNDFKITVEGDRKKGTPSPFEAIRIHFEFSGSIDDGKLARAIQLTADKYCSVKFCLREDIDITYTYQIN